LQCLRNFNSIGIRLGLSDTSIVVLGASNGIGGGLASVLSPAKIQNATAVIDKQGIEGEVIKKTAPIALLMVVSVSLITLCWANNYPAWKWVVVFAIGIGAVAVLLLSIFGINKLRNLKRRKRNELSRNLSLHFSWNNYFQLDSCSYIRLWKENQ